jgi:hypothetical protein
MKIYVCHVMPTLQMFKLVSKCAGMADVRGGDGDYDYDWDGDDGLNSSNYSPSMTYNTGGRKDATVRVRSDGQTETADWQNPPGWWQG